MDAPMSLYHVRAGSTIYVQDSGIQISYRLVSPQEPANLLCRAKWWSVWDRPLCFCCSDSFPNTFTSFSCQEQTTKTQISSASPKKFSSGWCCSTTWKSTMRQYSWMTLTKRRWVTIFLRSSRQSVGSESALASLFTVSIHFTQPLSGLIMIDPSDFGSS